MTSGTFSPSRTAADLPPEQARLTGVRPWTSTRTGARVMDASGGPQDGVLDPDLLARMDAYWRAANYLSVGQIYLKDNPLLEEPLTLAHVKPRLLGH
jgi:hypothetical protein